MMQKFYSYEQWLEMTPEQRRDAFPKAYRAKEGFERKVENQAQHIEEIERRKQMRDEEFK